MNVLFYLWAAAWLVFGLVLILRPASGTDDRRR